MQLYDVVELLVGLPDEGLSEGAVGTVIHIFERPSRAYEVEFVGRDGKTLATVALTDTQIRSHQKGDLVTDSERDPRDEEEVKKALAKWAFADEQWEEAVRQKKAEEAEIRRRLFGDREPFAIPDVDTDA
jgi:uncharacterized protein DUF4926